MAAVGLGVGGIFGVVGATLNLSPSWCLSLSWSGRVQGSYLRAFGFFFVRSVLRLT